jgi:hypothetical protein
LCSRFCPKIERGWAWGAKVQDAPQVLSRYPPSHGATAFDRYHWNLIAIALEEVHIGGDVNLFQVQWALASNLVE